MKYRVEITSPRWTAQGMAFVWRSATEHLYTRKSAATRLADSLADRTTRTRVVTVAG